MQGILKEVQTEVVLTAYNDVGCYNSDTVKIRAMACCEIFVPNAFSPNNDGINDYFKPQLTQGQLIVTFQIFDRWGQMVYENNAGNSKGWDGFYRNGRLADGGAYNYIILHSCDGQAGILRKGDITLLR